MERVDRQFVRGVVGVLAGEGAIFLVEPDRAEHVGRACAQRQRLAVGVLDGGLDGHVDCVGRPRHHAHRAPIARGLQQVLQVVGEVIAFGPPHVRGDIGLDLFVEFLRNIGIEYLDTDIEQQLFGNGFS